ncbi:hypothetical protein RRG08_039291 [Elysia crispata]|uniref:Uncharacterized protein n=1 Tax=Elysia crispata TaxID=231223 RepID=A0AAE0Z7G3_9GAST|nr:hypothetical protein RRG08_039291 [Elysia crispata]
MIVLRRNITSSLTGRLPAAAKSVNQHCFCCWPCDMSPGSTCTFSPEDNISFFFSPCTVNHSLELRSANGGLDFHPLKIEKSLRRNGDLERKIPVPICGTTGLPHLTSLIAHVITSR